MPTQLQKTNIRSLIFNVHQADFAKATESYKAVVRDKIKARYDQIVDKIREAKR